MVLDECGVITQGLIPGVDASVALIGVAEKGYVTLELTVEAEGGHSSMPPKHTAIGVLSRAITRIEERDARVGTALAGAEVRRRAGPGTPTAAAAARTQGAR